MRWFAAAAGSDVAGTGRSESAVAAVAVAVDDDDAAAAGTAVPEAVDVGFELS